MASDWIARASQDRAVVQKQGHQCQSPNPCLRERVLVEPVLYTQTIKVRGREGEDRLREAGRRQPRQSREAEVTVRAAKVTLRAPFASRSQIAGRHHQRRVGVRSKIRRKATNAIEWLLLTDLPIESLERGAADHCVLLPCGG